MKLKLSSVSRKSFSSEPHETQTVFNKSEILLSEPCEAVRPSSISQKSFSSEPREASRPSTISGKSSSPITVHSYRGGNAFSEIINKLEERS